VSYPRATAVAPEPTEATPAPTVEPQSLEDEWFATVTRLEALDVPEAICSQYEMKELKYPNGVKYKTPMAISGEPRTFEKIADIDPSDFVPKNKGSEPFKYCQVQVIAEFEDDEEGSSPDFKAVEKFLNKQGFTSEDKEGYTFVAYAVYGPDETAADILQDQISYAQELGSTIEGDGDTSTIINGEALTVAFQTDTGNASPSQVAQLRSELTEEDYAKLLELAKPLLAYYSS